MTEQPDLSFSGSGSLYILTANTDAGKAWIAEHIPSDAMQWGGGIAIEHRYVDDIANGAMADGLTVQ